MGSFTKLTCHIVYGTKYRRPTLKLDHREQIYQYIGGIIRSNKGRLVEIGGTEDHVHILANLSPSIAVSKIIQDIKGSSSKWANDNLRFAQAFEWQKGYSAFAVSYSGVRTVQQYIQNQFEHHRVRSFKEEYVESLKRHDIDFEDRYLFEGEHVG